MNGIIYFGHGARDKRWREPFDRLQSLWHQAYPNTPCELAFLEFMDPDLFGAIEKLITKEINHITIIPVFFGQGGHLRNDFPILIDQARKKFPKIQLSAAQPVGESDLILQSIIQFTLQNI